MADAPGSGQLAARDALYEQAAGEFCGALHRLARAYEANPDRRQDLLQDIHIALWRSFATFDGRCSLRTWVYIHRYAFATAMPENVALTTCLDFHRGQLVRHRDLLRRTWMWYLLPFVPGLLVLQIGRAAADHGRAPQVAMSAMISVLVFLGIGWLNQRAARKLDREIEALERAS